MNKLINILCSSTFGIRNGRHFTVTHLLPMGLLFGSEIYKFLFQFQNTIFNLKFYDIPHFPPHKIYSPQKIFQKITRRLNSGR